MRLLVLAPRFPAINQPWIDTYLEQLLLNGAELVVLSNNRSPAVYHPKVDILRLRERVEVCSLSMRSVVPFLLRHPLALLGLFRCWKSVWRSTPFDRTGSVARCLRLLHLLKNRGAFNVIHSHSEISAYQCLPLASLWKVPLVLTFHGLPPAGVGQLTFEKRKLLYRLAAIVIVNTDFAKSQVVNLGCPSDKVRVLPQGIPLVDFPYQDHVHVQTTPIKMLTVGRCDRQKGYGYALLALKRLLAGGYKVSWTFVGEGPDRTRIQRLASKLGVERALNVCPALEGSQLRELYQNSDILVLPSLATSGWQETQGVVLQEAQACGCLVIATRTGGIPECVTDGEDGLLVQPRSSRAIAEGVKRLVADEVLSSRLRGSGRALVERRFSADSVGLQMYKLLVNVANQPLNGSSAIGK